MLESFALATGKDSLATFALLGCGRPPPAIPGLTPEPSFPIS